jgi:hypothetical protein
MIILNDPRYFNTSVLFLMSFTLADQFYLGFFHDWKDILVAVITEIVVEFIII